jgi:hypothetical protein
MEQYNWQEKSGQIYTGLAVLLAVVVLFVSVSRASFSIWAQEADQGGVGVIPVAFKLTEDDGTIVEENYKLPEVKMLPNNPFYGFRKLRDQLWLVFSGNNLKKSQTALLIADKKMAEAEKLAKQNESNSGKLIIESVREAIERLKYADNLVSKTTKIDNQWKQLHRQIYFAGLAYQEVLKLPEELFGADIDTYKSLVGDLNNWNEKQKQDQSYLETN